MLEYSFFNHGTFHWICYTIKLPHAKSQYISSYNGLTCNRTLFYRTYQCHMHSCLKISGRHMSFSIKVEKTPVVEHMYVLT